jgi:hypothetical protein
MKMGTGQKPPHNEIIIESYYIFLYWCWYLRYLKDQNSLLLKKTWRYHKQLKYLFKNYNITLIKESKNKIIKKMFS